MPVKVEEWRVADGRIFPDEHSALVYESLQRKEHRLKELFASKKLLLGDSIKIKSLVEVCYIDTDFQKKLVSLLTYQAENS